MPAHSTPLPPFAEAQLALLADFGQRAVLPPIAALHLPPAESAGTKDGEFCAIELADGSIGLSYVMLDDTLGKLRSEGIPGAVAGRDPLDVAHWYATKAGVLRTVGFAAINALTRNLFDRAGYVPDFDTDSIGSLDPQPGDHIGMIGFFTPLVEKIAARGARLTVIELNPAFLGDHAGYRVTLEASELARCNKILSTSTVLLNDTLDRMLAECANATAFAMIGPGAGCLPDPLFARGVSLLGGAWIDDSEGFKAAILAGRRWGQYTRKFAIRRDRYPGCAALLERVHPR